MIMKKNQRVRLYGNDDPRPIRVHVDDLHPLSRIRAIVHQDRKNKLHCNVSRDILRSMVASQRHNRLLPTGEATVEELRLELERDCITIHRRYVADGHPVAHLCASLAEALVNWPRLLMGMKHMAAPCDYSVGPTHAIVRLARKAPFEANHHMNRVCKELVRAFCVSHGHLDFETVRRGFSRDKLRAWLKQQPFFWYNLYDDGTTDRPHTLHTLVCDDDDFLQVLMDELGRHWRTLPELDKIFERFDETEHAPAVEILFDSIERLGWTVSRMKTTERSKHPLVFPTACVTRPRHIGCSVDMLLEPPLDS